MVGRAVVVAFAFFVACRATFLFGQTCEACLALLVNTARLSELTLVAQTGGHCRGEGGADLTRGAGVALLR